MEMCLKDTTSTIHRCATEWCISPSSLNLIEGESRARRDENQGEMRSCQSTGDCLINAGGRLILDAIESVCC